MLGSASFQAYSEAVASEIQGNSSWRTGETYWNCLADIRPDIAELISGSDADCYSNDQAITPFLAKVSVLW